MDFLSSLARVFRGRRAPEGEKHTPSARWSLNPLANRFDKFTERARRVLRFAREEAENLKQDYIGTEHLLLGLTRETNGVSAIVLRELGVELDQVRSAVLFLIGRGGSVPPSGIGLTPRSRKVIELAVDEARRLNHSYIGTEHLLIGLAREGEGIAFGVLESMGVTLAGLRTVTLRVLARGGQEGPSLQKTETTSAEATIVPIAPDEEKRAQATGALRVVQSELSGFAGSGIERTVLKGFVVPRIARLLASLDESDSAQAVESRRVDVVDQLGPLRGLGDALRESGQTQMADHLSAAVEAVIAAMTP